MNHNNQQLPEQDFTDLETYGQLLFDSTPAAPPLSKQSKKTMLKNITGGGFAFSTKLGFGFAATAMAAFMLVFGIAQTSQPGSILYNLKLGADTEVISPIKDISSQNKAIIEQKQAELNTLKQSGASTDDISKAESELEKLLESSKNESDQKIEDQSKPATENSSYDSSEDVEDSEDQESGSEDRRERTRSN